MTTDQYFGTLDGAAATPALFPILFSGVNSTGPHHIPRSRSQTPQDAQIGYAFGASLRCAGARHLGIGSSTLVKLLIRSKVHVANTTVIHMIPPARQQDVMLRFVWPAYHSNIVGFLKLLMNLVLYFWPQYCGGEMEAIRMRLEKLSVEAPKRLC